VLKINKRDEAMRKYWLILAIVALLLFLVIVISYTGKPTAPKPTIQEEVATVEVDLKTIELTLGDYFSTNNTFPDRLISLTTPIGFIGTTPLDPFNLDRYPVGKGQNPYQYIKLGAGEQAEAIIFAYGPDKDDDIAGIVYDPTNGTTSNGDIFRRMSAPNESELKGAPRRLYRYENRQIARASDDNGIKEFMWALKSFRYDLRSPKGSAAFEVATTVIREGWRGELNDLKKLLETNQTPFALIHEGAKKPDAKSVIVEEDLDYKSGVPNFLAMQLLAKLMICRGKKLEAGGMPEKAIRNYIDTAKFGQSVGNFTLIAKRIDIALESMAYRALQNALINTQLDSAYLEELLEELGKLTQNSPPIATAFWHEHLLFTHTIEQTGAAMDFIKNSKTYRPSKRIPAFLFLVLAKNKIITNSRNFWTELIDNSKKSYPQAIMFDIMSRIQKMDPLNEMICSYGHSMEALERDTLKKAHAQAAKIMAALELFNRRNKTYPDRIDELAGILKPIPLDPFTERNFRYEKVGDTYKLYSAGPDMLNDMATLVYDPTNGTHSPGDIIFRE